MYFNIGVHHENDKMLREKFNVRLPLITLHRIDKKSNSGLSVAAEFYRTDLVSVKSPLQTESMLPNPSGLSDSQDDEPLSLFSSGTQLIFPVFQDQQDGHSAPTKFSDVSVDMTDVKTKSYAEHVMANLTDESYFDDSEDGPLCYLSQETQSRSVSSADHHTVHAKPEEITLSESVESIPLHPLKLSFKRTLMIPLMNADTVDSSNESDESDCPTILMSYLTINNLHLKN